MPDWLSINQKFKKRKSALQLQMEAADKAAEEDITPSESITQSLIAMRQHNANAPPVPVFEPQPREG